MTPKTLKKGKSKKQKPFDTTKVYGGMETIFSTLNKGLDLSEFEFLVYKKFW